MSSNLEYLPLDLPPDLPSLVQVLTSSDKMSSNLADLPLDTTRSTLPGTDI